MATTVFVKLNPDDWVEVSPGVNTAQVSNTTDTTVTYREGDTAPAANDKRGHQLRPYEILQYTLGVSGRVYMRSIREKSTVACTPGQSFFGCCEDVAPPATEVNNFLFMDGNNYIFMDGNNYGFN